MPIEVVMPEIGETVVSGTIVTWLKEVGDEVAEDESLVEVATDKANVEIPSPASGILQKILAEEGDEVEVGGLLAVIGEAGEASEEKPAETKKVPPKTEKEKPAPPEGEEPVEAVADKEAPAEAEVETVTEKKAPAETDVESVAERRRTKSSPFVRRMAKEQGIELSELEGSGADGRVTKEDLLDHIGATGKKPTKKAPTKEPAKAEKPAKKPAEIPKEELEEIIPLEGMRKAIAEHMVRSKRTSPHVTTIAEADMSAVVSIRDKNKEAYHQKHGISLTYLPFFISAAARALVDFPYLNSTLKDDQIIVKRYYHIGISVQTERGLMTPVIRNADRLDIEELGTALDLLARRSREGRLSLNEIQGGTFSVTSPGTYGAILSTPIINQPQAAILGIERIQKRAVVIDDAIAIRQMVYLCLSYDHRIVDGATSIQFLQRVRELLEAGDFELDICL